MHAFIRAVALLLVTMLCGLGARQSVGQDQPKDKRQGASQAEAFSDAVAGDVLNKVRDGLESHSPSLMLSAFDKSSMDAYSAFEDQIRAFFDRYESFRVRYRIAETTADQTGVALVDFEMEQVPRGENAPPQRRIAQLRFEFKRGPKGWKIVDLRPKGFFS